jgi:hypothetical protein
MNKPIQFAHLPKMRDIDTVEIDGTTFAGAELRAILADRVTRADGWISVKDARKPPPGKVVIFWVYGERHEEDDDGNRVVHDVSGIHTGEWRVSEHGNYFDCHSTPCADIEGVTHWMDPPLPSDKDAAP